MNIAMDYLHDQRREKIEFSKQMGVTHAVINASRKGQTVDGQERPWEYAPLLQKIKSFEDMGLKVSVIEGPTPLDNAKLGLPGRDREIEVFQTFLRTLGRLKIPTVCYNWMPIVGWFRTNVNLPSRGGARVTGYNHELMANAPLTEAGVVSADTMWKNLKYFLEAVVPVAEDAGVELAIHPDDPPVDSLQGIARILVSAEAFQKVIDLVPSKYNGITLCQGSFSAMGENVPELILRFGKQKKIFFAHFRDIRGTAANFTETFHDDGQTDMYECMKRYFEIDFKGCIRPDHVPAMWGEENINPGYTLLGNLFAVGYMKGLMEAAAGKKLS
ncbi:MAG: mannonate dehydratase [Treponema sp.]|nr:mannonate dehydratase [Treponema sp.]